MDQRPSNVIFLLDVDNTLLDNDAIIADLNNYLTHEVGPERAQSYWNILEHLGIELGYADYLGALQLYRSKYPHELGLLTISRFLINYPFANRLFPNSINVIKHLRQWGTVVLLSDGDIVFQPHKVDLSGLNEAVDGHTLIYMHKENELSDVEARYPAVHYVIVDDKLRILSKVKKIWGLKVTTVFAQQGSYALNPKTLDAYPAADQSIEHISDLLNYNLQNFVLPIMNVRCKPTIDHLTPELEGVPKYA